MLIYNNMRIYEGKVKSSSLSYNRRKIQDKQPLCRDPDRSVFSTLV